MELQMKCACGLDVHQATVVACLLTVQGNGKVKKQIRAFGTTTRELVGLREWLQAEGCTHLAMESTGVDWTLAAVIIAELGVDMKVFQTASQLASWAGVCPGNNESAGRRKSGRVTRGNVHLKTALVEAAQASTRAKGTYLRDKFYRLKARRGAKRAVVAIAHKILVAAYHMLSQQVSYNDLGDLYLDKLNKQHLTRNLVRRLERIGWRVTLEQAAAEALESSGPLAAILMA